MSDDTLRTPPHIQQCPDCGAPLVEEIGGESCQSLVAYRCSNPQCGFSYHLGD